MHSSRVCHALCCLFDGTRHNGPLVPRPSTTGCLLLHVLLLLLLCHSQAGAAGIGIITLLRVVSSAAVGNTAPAALVYLTEHAPQCPSLHASLVPASMAAGACAASSLALLLSWVMSPAVLAASGWRVVLVMSLLGNAVTGWLRGYVLQEPEGKMQAVELLDRGNAHVGTILRWVVVLRQVG